jgi:Rrf2 family iron-sulfur cluster assembly transcriptional regulator
MRLTSKGRYAVRAMLDLTFNSNGNPVRLQEISTRQAISLHYLEQLFRKLRTGRAVKSVRGPGGGYVLARSMDEISIKDILECVGENINPARDISGKPSSGVETKVSAEGMVADVITTEFNLTKSFFQNLGILMQEYLTTTTLGDLQRKSREFNTNTPAAASNDNAQALNTAANASTNSSMNTSDSTGTASVIRPNIGEFNQ